MKIRQGFVSNSSSTSFCLIVLNNKDFNEALEKLHPFYQALVREHRPEEGRLLGEEFKIFFGEDSSEDVEIPNGYVGEVIDFYGNKVGYISEGEDYWQWQIGKTDYPASVTKALEHLVKLLGKETYLYTTEYY